MRLSRRCRLLSALAALAALAAALALVAAPGHAKSRIAGCQLHLHRIALGSSLAGEASQVYATLLMWNTGSTPCLLHANTGIQFRDLHGRKLAVERVHLDPVSFHRIVPAHGYVSVTWDWANWCGRQHTVSYRFRLHHVRLERRAAPPPCLGHGRRSKVGLDHIGVWPAP